MSLNLNLLTNLKSSYHKDIIENGNLYLLKFDEDTNSIVNWKKSEEEDFLRYECSEKVKKVIDLERIHQIKLTKEYEYLLKCQLKDRMDKYTEFFKINAVLFKEFLIIKDDIETQKILKKKENLKRSLMRIKSACLMKLPTTDGAKIHGDNQKVYKTRKCNIFEELKRIPSVINSVKIKITGNNCIKMMAKDTSFSKNISKNFTAGKVLNKIDTVSTTFNEKQKPLTIDGKTTENQNIQLPEYFYFKKFNKEEFDRIYKRHT